MDDGLIDWAKSDRREFDRLQTAVKTKLDTKSYLGNQFRDFLAKSKVAKSEYTQLGNDKHEEYRHNWVELKFKNFKETKVFKTSWRRVDSTTGRYLNFAALVVALGGWESEEALQGAAERRSRRSGTCQGNPR